MREGTKKIFPKSRRDEKKFHMNKNIRNARDLRASSTDTERVFWSFLRNRRFLNLKFRRQHPVDNYIADFACIEIGLVIELDGSQHAVNREYDAERERIINEAGFKVVRFWNNDVLTNTEGALERLRSICLERMERSS